MQNNKIKSILVNRSLTVILSDGTILVNNDADMELLNKVKQCDNEEDIIYLIAPELSTERKKEKEEIALNKEIVNNFQILVDTGDFEVENNCVYIKGIKRSLPKLLVQKFVSVVNAPVFDLEGYKALKNFWMWCCLNPRAEVADSLYEFLEKNCFRINKQGFFFALRNVVSLEGEKTELSKFVSNQYVKIKSWKKNPANYTVYERQDAEIMTEFKISTENHGGELDKEGKVWKSIGNLKDLYLELPEMEGNRYTDAHTQTFDIRLGRVVSMPMEKCSWSTVDCAEAGLHWTLNEIHYVGCGDTSVIVLINPMKVVGVGSAKGRCYEYLPIAAVDREEATQILHDLNFDTLQLEEEYAIEQLEGLEEKAKENFSIEAKKYEFNISPISSKEMHNIINNLNKFKDEISNRVVAL